MHLIVTGASGFIGRYVVAAALERGHAVTAIMRDEKKGQGILPQHQALQMLMVRDMTEIEPRKILTSDDALIHLAWAGVGKYTDPQNLLNNLEPQFLFLQSMIAAGLQNMTVAGSCLEYGLQEGVAKEEDGTSPVTFYGLAKKTLCEMLQISLPENVALKWLRYFYVYGEGQRPQAIIPQLRAAIARGDRAFNMSPGDQGRDFIHVKTAAFNTVLAAEQTAVTGIINICNGRPLTVAEVVESVLAAEGYNMSLNKGFYGYPAYEPFSFWGDAQKMSKIPEVRRDVAICT